MTGRTPKPTGLYIHIPFCHARCGYCDFVTFTGKEDKIDEYIEDLCREMELYTQVPSTVTRMREGWDKGTNQNSALTLSPLPRSAVEGNPKIEISTIFFGGGTPSVLEPRHLRTIFRSIHRHFNVQSDAEITLEA